VHSKPRALNPLGLYPQELEEVIRGVGLESYRWRQVFRAVQRQQRGDWDQVTVLPPVARATLKKKLPLVWPRLHSRFVSHDGTVRYLLELGDGRQVEAVYLPDEKFDSERGTQRLRHTLCVSSQVGCPVNCGFCLTAQLGLERNLEAGEIVAEVLTLLREHRLRPGAAAGDRVNLVFMGMGEPFLNYGNVMRAVRLLSSPEGAGISTARMTISTSGVIAKIVQFGAEPVRPHLAISLNATTDEQRDRLMPLNRGQGGIGLLMETARKFPLRPRERLTFEYVLLDGVNDTNADAERLVRLVQGIRCKVNLIAWNGSPELPFRTPAEAVVRSFQARLGAAGISVFIRRPRGRDIFAACGQLKREIIAPAMLSRHSERPDADVD
jgi:23S rRNA (adenine2503-C2)-methyltransferase